MTKRPNRKPNRKPGLEAFNAVWIEQAEDPETCAVKVHVTYAVGLGQSQRGPRSDYSEAIYGPSRAQVSFCQGAQAGWAVFRSREIVSLARGTETAKQSRQGLPGRQCKDSGGYRRNLLHRFVVHCISTQTKSTRPTIERHVKTAWLPKIAGRRSLPCRSLPERGGCQKALHVQDATCSISGA
jgi:hypothetical protein